MAYVNIAEWTYDQVADWLKGLEDVIHPYIHSFVLNKVDGNKLIYITPSDLIKLDIVSIGHQEIILQAVALLKSLYYHLHQENAQHLALKLSSKSRSIYNELCLVNPPDLPVTDASDASARNDLNKCPLSEKASTRTLLGVTDVLSSVKALVGWLNMSPFNGLEEYDDLKGRFVELGIGLATIAQRDAFADKQTSVIRDICFQLAQMADQIIQELKDPMILQPAWLDVATLKKRTEDTFGISLISTYHGIHQIAVLRALSPAHNSGKLMGGDQIIQVNYQTVIGWTSMKVTHLMQENPSEVILTIKKSPRNVNTLSNIYFKPFRLPSKKRTYSPWATNGFASNRFDLQSIPNLQFVKSFDGKAAVQRVVSTEPHNQSISPPPSNPATGSTHSLDASDSDTQMGTHSSTESDLSDDTFLSETELVGAPSSLSVRLFSARPRPPAQRRATIPGATTRPLINYDQIMRECCTKVQTTLPSSCSVGFTPQTQSIVATSATELRATSVTPSGEEMPFIDELDESDQPNGSPALPARRKGFIDKADLPDADPLIDPETALSCDSHLELTAIDGRVVSRARLDKTVSSPVYDDYGKECKTLFQTSIPVVMVKPNTHIIDSTKEKSTDQSVHKDAPSDEETKANRPSEFVSPAESVADATSESRPTEPVESFIEATYINQVSEAQFQRRLGRGNGRISCRDLGQGDQQGWLYRRKEHKGFLLPHRWVKRWFILNKSIIYGYKDRDSLKADSLIYLPGFHVSPAPEVKAKRFAFKIFHSRGGATFYFACESGEERSRWMSQMGLSAISSTTSRVLPQLTSEEAYYSETDDELEDKHSFRSSSRSSAYSGSHSTKLNSSISSQFTAKASPLSYFSSSKSQPLKFLQSSRAALSNPVPTSNFRSYVRVRDLPTAAQPESPSSPKIALGLSKHKVKDGSVTLGKEVRRKNSIRERLMQLPNLAMGRRKSSQKQSTDVAVSSPKRICTTSKSETSLVLKEDDHRAMNISHSQSGAPLVPESGHARTPVSNCFLDSPAMSNTVITQSNDPTGTESGDIFTTGVKSEKSEVSPSQASSHFKTCRDGSGIKLKCASQYYPVTLGKDKKETMQTAFQMNLSQSSTCSGSPSPPQKLPRNSVGKECESPKIRPHVPPRTKFLSPNERRLPDAVDELNSPISRISRTNQPPNLVISPVPDDGDSPKTPFKPTMGVAMIGKQRRTPTTISPKEILPHYPGMEYPPTFEAESYSLSPQRGIYSPETPMRPTLASPHGGDSATDCYVNINSSGDESKAFHHQIYVTSPFTNNDVSPEGSYCEQGSSPQSSFHRQGPSPQSSFHSQGPSPQSSFHRQGPSPQTSFHRQGPSPQTSFHRPGPSPQTSFYRQGPSPQSSFQRQATPQDSFYGQDITSQSSYQRIVPSAHVSFQRKNPSPQSSLHRQAQESVRQQDISPHSSFYGHCITQSSFQKQDSSPQNSFHRSDLPPASFLRKDASPQSSVKQQVSAKSSFNRQVSPQHSLVQQNISQSKQYSEKSPTLSHVLSSQTGGNLAKQMSSLNQTYQHSRDS